MKEFIAKNPKVVGSIIGFILAALLSLVGLKLADVCPAPEVVPAVVEAPPAVVGPVKESK
jgi:hypothetical protein